MSTQPDNIVPITPDARTAAEKFSAEHDRELLTILFTDLVDSTQLQSDLGNVEAARLTELHRKIVRDELANYDAREIEWAGDSCLAVFTKPSDAVVFALRMQSEHRRTRESEPKLPTVRVGMHLGEIVVKKGDTKTDLFGLQVSEAARIMSVARGNQIYCSRAVYDSARSVLHGDTVEGLGEVLWTRHGHYLLKGSEDPVEICEVCTQVHGLMRPPKRTDKCRPVRPDTLPTSWFGRGIAVVVVLAVGLGSWWVGNDRDESTDVDQADETTPQIALIEPDILRTRRISLSLPDDQPLAPPYPIDSPLALSPDGEIIAYNSVVDGERYLILRRGDELEGHIIPGTRDVDRPFFSPDGEWVACIAMHEGKRRLIKIHIERGEVFPLADVAIAFPSSWSDQGYIVYTPFYGSGLMRVSEEGGESEPLTTLKEGEVGHSFPNVLPGGKGIFYTSFTAPSIDSARLVFLNFETNEETIIMEKAGGGDYLSTGHIVLTMKGAMKLLPFDIDTLTVTGEPFDVTEDKMVEPNSLPSRRALSSSGTLAYVPTGLDAADAVTLVWADRQGREEKVESPPPGLYRHLDIAPNGLWASVTVDAAVSSDIWRLDIERGAFQRITFDVSSDVSAIVTPDSEQILFLSNRRGAWGVYRKAIDGSSDSEYIYSSGTYAEYPRAFADNGTTVLFDGYIKTGKDITRLSFDESTTSYPVLNSDYDELDPQVSPNGRWLAYSSNETGREEVYVRAYPGLGSKVQISVDGGRDPKWSADSHELIYRENRTRFMSVRFDADPDPQPSAPEFLFEGNYYSYDVHPDGQRFLLVKATGDETLRVGGTKIIVVENWFEDIRRRTSQELP